MVSKLCCRSHGHPVPWVRSAAMISISRAMSREGVIARSRGKRTRRCGPYNARRRLRHPLRTRPETSPAAAGIRPARPTAPLLASVTRALGLATRLEQEPAAFFRLVDEYLEEACGCDVFMLVGDLVRRAHVADVRLVIVHQLEQHVDRRYVILIVVLDPLQLGDVADRPDRGAADPAHPFGQNVDAVFQLAGLLVEQKVVVAEMRAAHVPMEVLGLEIEREGIGQERVERRRYLANGLGRKVGWSIEPCRGGARFKVSDFAAHGLPHGWKGTDTKAAAGTDVHSTADTKGRYSCPVRLATGRPGIRIRDIMEHLRSSKFRRTRHPAA